MASRALRLAGATSMWAVALAWGSGAAGATGPTLTVTPSTGLADGQTVTVDGSGFPPSNPMTFPYPDRSIMVCRQEAIEAGDPDSLTYGCGNDQGVDIAEDGTFTASLVVHRVVQAQTGGGSFRCDEAPRQCAVIELAFGSRGYRLEASAPISFSSK